MKPCEAVATAYAQAEKQNAFLKSVTEKWVQANSHTGSPMYGTPRPPIQFYPAYPATPAQPYTPQVVGVVMLAVEAHELLRLRERDRVLTLIEAAMASAAVPAAV